MAYYHIYAERKLSRKATVKEILTVQKESARVKSKEALSITTLQKHDAVRHEFNNQGVLGKRYSHILKDSMSLREDADYGGEFSKDGASLSINNAEEFIKRSREILVQK